MKNLEQEVSPAIGFLYCTLAVIFFVLLVAWAHPIIVAASYTTMSIVLYRISYNTFVQTDYGGSDFDKTIFAFICAAVWPLYFFFGAYMFLHKAIRRE